MKKEIEEKDKYLVLRDSHEKAGYGWLFEPSDNCAGTLERKLKTGDYSLDGYYDNNIFVIERKGSVAEFVGNITQKDKWDDFKKELIRLEEFKHPFIILEFPFSLLMTYPIGSNLPRGLWDKTRVKPAFILKRLLEIEIHFKTKIICAETSDNSRSVAASLFKRIVENAKP
jgi:hypothetical protein